MSSEDSTNEYQFRQLLESRPDPSTISAEIMAVAEKITWNEVLFRIHPTLDEFEKRADIILFLQEMVTQSFEGIQAFPYGSVPLKTYLGHGDIDLTVICEPVEKDLLAEGMYALLKYEEQNSNAEYTVKETKLIGAEVKLVRCKIENVPVDISFNQLGGLSTVCFLEKVDHLINKNHLFKRSVLLIKAWCHYECRILGAYHGLLATYALEALILFIFQLFGSSLNGPLAVLYRFLDYYGKFDWDNNCISLDGPVRTSSLPDLVVTDRGNDGAELLFSGENMRFYTDLFAAATSSNGGQDVRIFGPMHLNIIDPIKKNNNLGRSIYKGNALRIRAAFNYGARNLGRILQLPSEYISDEIKMFFECTRMWHRGSGVIPESLSPLLLSDEEDFQLKSVEGDTDDADTMSDEEGLCLEEGERDW
ncbi:PAP-associated domain-containing protein [Heracleum sosnowskyi]|uniref:PAP-associated domain-containing protein n=1 Tax=Heracleum sosnowskyi TaxID=360622 RepID=A0AAD8M9S7_9APIA|nr:PAP-associated domain-containing protein [Heracleum sosnowskyi]